MLRVAFRCAGEEPPRGKISAEKKGKETGKSTILLSRIGEEGRRGEISLFLHLSRREENRFWREKGEGRRDFSSFRQNALSHFFMPGERGALGKREEHARSVPNL